MSAKVDVSATGNRIGHEKALARRAEAGGQGLLPHLHGLCNRLFWFWALTLAVRVVTARAAMHLQRLGIKGFLLLGVQRCVEGFGGLVALLHARLHLGMALVVQGLHGVDALRRGHVGKSLAVWALAGGRALGLDRRGVRGPGSFLAGVQLERGFERLQTLFPMRLALLWAGTMALASGRGRCRRSIGAGSLGKGGYREGGEHGGHDGAALQERHGVSFLKSGQKQWKHCDGYQCLAAM